MLDIFQPPQPPEDGRNWGGPPDDSGFIIAMCLIGILAVLVLGKLAG